MHVAKQTDTLLVIHRYPNFPIAVSGFLVFSGLVISLATFSPLPLLIFSSLGIAPFALGHFCFLTLDKSTFQITIREGRGWQLKTSDRPLYSVEQVDLRVKSTYRGDRIKDIQQYQVVMVYKTGGVTAINPTYSKEPGQRQVATAIRRFLTLPNAQEHPSEELSQDDPLPSWKRDISFSANRDVGKSNLSQDFDALSWEHRNQDTKGQKESETAFLNQFDDFNESFSTALDFDAEIDRLLTDDDWIANRNEEEHTGDEASSSHP